MESLGSIKLRIASVGSTAQITRALQMVSVSKMTKAQQAATSSSDYTDSVKELMHNALLSVAGGENGVAGAKLPSAVLPYVQENKGKPVLVVIFSPTKGFCGALVGNTLRSALKLIEELKEEGHKVEVVGLQKKSQYIIDKLSDVEINSIFLDNFEGVFTNMISGEATHVLNEFLGDKYSKVLLLYPKFISTFHYEVTSEQILPVSLEKVADVENSNVKNDDFIVEPDLTRFMAKALDTYILTVFLNAALHTKASEHSARMIAMKNATESAEKLGDDLQLMYNRIRQESITSELLDIVGGISR